MSSRRQTAAVLEFNDDPISDNESSRESFDVDSERDGDDGDVDAERQSYAIQMLNERVSELLIPHLPTQPRRRMTEPPQYTMQRREEITVEPITATRVRFPTTVQFEHGRKLSRRATYTPSFSTPQFFSSLSLQGKRESFSGVSRASLGSHMALEKKVEYDRSEEPEQFRDWSKSLPPSTHFDRSPPTSNNQAEVDVSSATKGERRRRFKAAVRRWFH